MPEASPFWQNAFLGFVILICAWSVWCGWRAGLVREVLALGGMFAGGFAGLAAGGFVGSIAARIFPVPGVLIGLVVGLMVGIGIYVGIWFLGALIFKRTAQQRTMPLRLLYGVGGALMGLFVGVTFVWGALLFVRGLGGFYQGRFEPEARGSRLPPPNVAEAMLVKLKRSIEAGPTGRQLVAIDVMPETYYRVLDKLGRVVAQPVAMRRLLEYPEIQELLNDPRIVALTTDPTAAEEARAKGVGGLMSNPRILAAANDPALIAKLEKIDIERALDFALAPAGATPKPSPHPAKSP
jgi:hypothetical protein